MVGSYSLENSNLVRENWFRKESRYLMDGRHNNTRVHNPLPGLEFASGTVTDKCTRAGIFAVENPLGPNPITAVSFETAF